MTEHAIEHILTESVDSLELPGVLEEISVYAFSIPGRSAILESTPDTSVERISRTLDLVSQVKEAISLNGPIGLSGLLPMDGVLAKLANPSSVLDAEEMLIICDFVQICDSAKRSLDGLDERYNLLRGLSGPITYMPHVVKYLETIFDEHGEVKPSASPRLIRIHERARSAREGVRRRLERVIQDRDLSRIVQEDYITLRNDRYVILLRPEFKGLLDGIVHDHSRSGASVYVEPFNVIELNNQIASVLDEEREEIRRIFVEATGRLRESREELEENYSAVVFLDAYQARAAYALATNAVKPILSQDDFRILSGRHPLLSLEESEVVPMDVIQDANALVTVISGANMGGKTVALKIAGLFPLMTRCGILLPAKEGTVINPFSRIMVDIGDEQDIKGRVSSFSGHITRIKAIVENSRDGDLALLDELGGATDPEEGSALAMAILDELSKRRVRVVVTTHLTQLKAYALSRPFVKNVSVEFHPVSLKPTYRLLYDFPGESHAIATAERIGLAPEVVAAARGYLDRSGGGGAQLIKDLREKLAEVEQTSAELSEMKSQTQSELHKIAAEKEFMLEDFRIEARTLLAAAQRQITELQQSLKNKKPDRPAPRPAEVLNRLRSDLTTSFGPLERTAPAIEVGATVRLKKFGKQGQVTDILDGGKIEVAVRGLNIKTDVDEVEIISTKSTMPKPAMRGSVSIDQSDSSPGWDIKVIGMRGDEAISAIEKAIDKALMAGLYTLNIIHGKGTGRLKKIIREYLAKSSLVKSYRGGDLNLGGEGVTIVELAFD